MNNDKREVRGTIEQRAIDQRDADMPARVVAVTARALVDVQRAASHGITGGKRIVSRRGELGEGLGRGHGLRLVDAGVWT